MKRTFLVAGLFAGMFASASAVAENPAPAPLEAVTISGEKVRLHPNGRWEFVDPVKAAAASKLAAQFPENKLRPVDAQGSLFGSFGRTIMPGEPDYNRGSLNPKTR